MTVRQQTRVAVRLDSHISGEQDLSPDVIHFSSSKAIKSTGRFQLTLVPRRNYINLIYPNDIVNVYVDPGDGKRGFIRTMMGYVDRIERTESTDASTGAVTTMFQVSCSDFLKAVEKTDIYFNPHLRIPVDKRFGAAVVAGSTLRTKGIVAHGGPADFVENFLYILMGFGQQWSLPKSYPAEFVRIARERRRQRAESKIPTNLQERLMALGLPRLDVLNQDLNVLFDEIRKNTGGLVEQLTDVDAISGGQQKYIENQQELAKILTSQDVLTAYRTVLDSTSGKLPPCALDLLDFSFVEALTIDGYSVNTAVWENQGSVAQFVYGHSNEIVNELCFDLRPVTVGADGDPYAASTEYSHAPDELKINTNGYGNMPASVSAVQYVPAVVMREYPYSTVAGVNLEQYKVLGAPVGFIPFGPIFAQSPNPSGPKRVVYDYLSDGVRSLIPESCLFAQTGRPLKYLDVIPITSQDVVGSNLGRSDEDVFNLFALSATNSGRMAELWKYYLSDFSPIMNYVSIARNGLRVRESSSEFSNYSRDPECLAGSSAVDNSAIRRNLVRWQLMMDQWYQHNPEYLSGTINVRSMPEIRVGMRLDWTDRSESYYVEQVSHEWEYPGPLRTTLQVSRGQRNDPFPAYIPPAFTLPNGNELDVTHSGNRSEQGRLGLFFQVKDTPATQNAMKIGGPVFEPSTVYNDIDIEPNANFDGVAEYSGQPATPERDPLSGDIV